MEDIRQTQHSSAVYPQILLISSENFMVQYTNNKIYSIHLKRHVENVKGNANIVFSSNIILLSKL